MSEKIFHPEQSKLSSSSEIMLSELKKKTERLTALNLRIIELERTILYCNSGMINLRLQCFTENKDPISNCIVDKQADIQDIVKILDTQLTELREEYQEELNREIEIPRSL